MSLKGQVAMVTGASRGIGRAIALQLAARGAALVVTATTLEAARHTAEEIEQAGGKVVDAVTKAVTLLVVGADAGSNKVRQADKFGTRQISEAELLARLEGTTPDATPPAAPAGALHQQELFSSL